MTILLRQYQNENGKINFIKNIEAKVTDKEAQEIARHFTII